MAQPLPPLVAFDLDGTLTWADSYLAFLKHRSGASAYYIRLATLAPSAAAFAAHRDRGRLKTALGRAFLGGADAAAVALEAERFAEGPGRRLFREDALAAVEAWRARGAEMVVVTACPRLVAAPLAARIGLNVIATELEFIAGTLTGRIKGANCRGAEKVRRLRERFGDRTLTAAYGDSSGDKALLAEARTAGWRVFKSGPPRRSTPPRAR